MTPSIWTRIGRWLSWSAKFVVAVVGAAGVIAATALEDGSISTAEWLTIAAAAAIPVGVWLKGNGPHPDEY